VDILPKMETITLTEIEKDIINALKQPQDKSKIEYEKIKIPTAIITFLLIIIEFIYPLFIVWGIIAFVVFVVGYNIIGHFRLKHKIKQISINDYEIKTYILSHTTEENYVIRMYKARDIIVYNCCLYFENGEVWNVPKDNYLWSKEQPMSAFAIHESSHRGDSFTVVIKKDTGNIVMAYNTKLFKYKNAPRSTCNF